MGHFKGVLAVAFHAQVQGFAPCQKQEGILGGEGRAQIAQPKHAAGNGKGDIAEGLVELEAVIAVIRFTEGRVVAGG